jgi:type IV secretory pathway VirB10-like protein
VLRNCTSCGRGEDKKGTPAAYREGLLNFPDYETYRWIRAFAWQHWRIAMASSAKMFFAGVGTTFLILAVGFGGGLMLAKSALQDTPPQTRASSETTSSESSGVRVILPASAEPAPQSTAAVPTPAPAPPPQPAQHPQAPVQNQVEPTEAKKSERDLRAERRKRQAERVRKMERRELDRAPQRLEQDRREAGIVALGGDEPRMGSFFGN